MDFRTTAGICDLADAINQTDQLDCAHNEDVCMQRLHNAAERRLQAFQRVVDYIEFGRVVVVEPASVDFGFRGETLDVSEAECADCQFDFFHN